MRLTESNRHRIAAAFVLLTTCLMSGALALSGARAAGQVPFDETNPTIAGEPAVGQTLLESHGLWKPAPTSYEINWMRCDGMGNSCSYINNASGSSYTLTPADAGHTIVVREVGSNAAGTPQRAGFSDPTAVVYTGTPYRFSLRSSIGFPQFAYYLIEHHGHRPSAHDWRRPTGNTVTPGQLALNLKPGDTVWFQATTLIGVPLGVGSPTRVEDPAGVSGISWHVPAGAPRDPHIVMPAVGRPYNPGLSKGELWVLGQLNRRRRARGEVALRASTVLDAAASVEARDEATNGRWPDPYFYTVPPSVGWPGDLSQGYAIADAPLRTPQQVLNHWDGSSAGESTGIWHNLSDPFMSIVGIADGGGAWNIIIVAYCPAPDAARTCGLTNVTGL